MSLFAPFKFHFDIAMHLREKILKALQNFTMEISAGLLKDIASHAKEDSASLSEELVSHPSDFLLESVQFVTQKVVHEEFTLLSDYKLC